MRVILFNLVPYREIWERQQLRYVLIQLTLPLVVFVSCIWVLNTTFDSVVDNYEANLRTLSVQQAKVAKKNEQIIAYQEELQRLKSESAVLIQMHGVALDRAKLFAELSHTKPENVAVSKVVLEPRNLTIYGITRHLPSLSAWADTLNDDRSLLSNCDIETVNQKKDILKQQHEFILRAQHRLPTDSGVLNQLLQDLSRKELAQ